MILIGGSSHAGKSTLGRSLAAKLGWNYRSTDKLARHPGRPWVSANRKVIPEYVAEHYGELSVNALFLDVLSHYEKNVLPQVEAIVHSHTADLSTECLILEGSALLPGFVANLVGENAVKALWLTASDQLFQNRIFSESNFYMEGFWSLLRSWLRPHRGISQAKLPLYLGFFEFVHNTRKRGCCFAFRPP